MKINNEIEYKILRPKEFSGSIYGDFGYELNGVRSEKGYVSKAGAEKALVRAIEKLKQN